MNFTRIATAAVTIRKSQVGLGDSSGCSTAAGDDLEPTGSKVGARCWWRNWLRRRVTSRKIVGSKLDGVTGIFHLHTPCLALGLTQPPKKMSTRNISMG
jgi:hypothetical protein